MPKRTKARKRDPATGRFVRRRTDDSSGEQQPAPAQEADELAQFNEEYDEWEERMRLERAQRDTAERMRMERNVARPSKTRICINGVSLNLRETFEACDNDDEQEEPVPDPDEAGPSQPIHVRMMNLGRLQGRRMEQMAARHRQEAGQANSEIDKLRASMAETQRMRDALNSVFPPSSERRSEEDELNLADAEAFEEDELNLADAEAFEDAQMTGEEMSHAYDQHVQARLIRSSFQPVPERREAPAVDRLDLVCWSIKATSC